MLQSWTIDYADGTSRTVYTTPRAETLEDILQWLDSQDIRGAWVTRGPLV